MTKLNQVIAIEKGIKSRSYNEIGELHKANQKNDLFTGFKKHYEKIAEDGEELPSETKEVRFTVKQVFGRLQKLSDDLLQITARKEWTNTQAFSDVSVNGKIVLSKVPVTYLLFLEKQITDIRTFVDNLPVLDSGERWTEDKESGLYKSAVVSTHRTKKVTKPLVLYHATDKHPAQTQTIVEDVIAGHWKQEKHSGAVPLPEKQKLQERVEKLLIAVKEAREAANDIEEHTGVPEVGDALFNYILGKE